MCLDLAFCVSKYSVLRFFFLAGVSTFTQQSALLRTVHALFTHYLRDPQPLYSEKNIKNGSTVLFTHLKIILLQCF